MPAWRNISRTIPTPPWRNWGRCLTSAPSQFGKPAAACSSREKKTLRYTERDEDARAQFQDELADVEPQNLVYLDESGVDDTLQRGYARAPRGQPVFGEVTGAQAHRISLIAALHESRLLAPMRFEGYGDTLVFNAWLEQVLLPELRPGQIVVMDNASFHKSPTTRTLIESKGCTLKYLPTYSPDLNPIEPQWAILKARLRKHKTPHQSLDKAIDQIFAMY
jgi:transposase